MAEYYVVTRSNWQGDDWNPTAGPYTNKKEAEKAAEKAELHPVSDWGGIDLKSQRHAQVVSRTWLRQNGWINDDILTTIVESHYMNE